MPRTKQKIELGNLTELVEQIKAGTAPEPLLNLLEWPTDIIGSVEDFDLYELFELNEEDIEYTYNDKPVAGFILAEDRYGNMEIFVYEGLSDLLASWDWLKDEEQRFYSQLGYE